MFVAHIRRGASAIEKPVSAGCTLLKLEYPSLLNSSLYFARYLSPQFTQPIKTCKLLEDLPTYASDVNAGLVQRYQLILRCFS